MKFLVYVLLLFSASYSCFSQKNPYSFETIPDSLKQNINAIVRLNQVEVTILGQRNMTITTNRQITVINEKGLTAIDAVENYDKKTSVTSIEATVFNALGIEIKKIKKKDFRDQCVTSDGTIFSDSRVLYLDYTPTDYPFTIIYKSEVQTSNTALIKPFAPITNYYCSVEKSIFNLKFPENLGFKYKESNFEHFQITKTVDTKTQLGYEATNLTSQKNEDLSLNFRDLYPIVYFSLEHFNLEGVDGTAKNWAEYGIWFYSKILEGTADLSDDTKLKIKKLVGSETDIIEKAKIVYKFVQEKSRYISIQVGIGGFKPMKASDVDRLGYGDCKGLSNYTRALLEVVGVSSFYTELYAGNEKVNIQKDFFSIQGNHAMLCIPYKNENVFLECTSQDNPFVYQSVFTDDRDVLIIKPDGGEVLRTSVYENKANVQNSKGNFEVLETGLFSGNLEIVTEGSQYARSVSLQNMLPLEKEKHYKEYFRNIDNLHIVSLNFTNDKEKVRFTENIKISAENYGKLMGNNIIFNVNAYNQYHQYLKKNKIRKTDFGIARGFFDQDEIEIDLPSNYQVETLPSNFELNNKFGNYKTEIVKKSSTKLVYMRSFFMKKAIYKKSEFEEYRLYLEQISRNDNAKIILTKKT